MSFERRRRSWMLALSLVAMSAPCLAAQPAAGPPAEVSPASAEVSRKAAAIARQTMSPFCPGRTLADCPSNYATEWRKDIRDMVARGMTPEQIQAELFSRAGGDLSGIPNRQSSYWLPIGFGLAALALLAFVLGRLRRVAAVPSGAVPSGPKETAAAPPAESVDDQRLAAELEAESDDD